MTQNQMENNKKMSSSKIWCIVLCVIVVILLFLIITLNTCSFVAIPLGKLPVVGGFFRALTFREYDYGDEVEFIDIDAPKIEETTQETNNTSKFIIEEYIEKYSKEFEDELRNDGYENVIINAEIVKSTDKYYTIKLSSYESSADGMEEIRYYTIDKDSGKLLQLADLFKSNSNFEKVIADYISDEMRNQMKNDSSKTYWVDDKEVGINMEDAVKAAQFYTNENNDLVMVFQEGEVAPMSMGTIIFKIPSSILVNIRK